MEKINVAIVGLIVALSVIGYVGIVLLDTLDETGEDVATSEDTFSVGDPDSDKVCSLSYDPEGEDDFTVRYYNGTGWKTLTSSDYTLSGSTLTVSSSAMD